MLLLSTHSTLSDSPTHVGTVSVVIDIRHNQCEDIKKALVRHVSLAWYPEDFYFKIMNLEWFAVSFVFWLFNPNSNHDFKDFSITATTRNICLFVFYLQN